MIEIGIDQLKVEGRMKSIHYIATVVSVYRKVIDAYCADPEILKLSKNGLKNLEKCANRETASAFFEGVPGFRRANVWKPWSRRQRYDFAGLVLDYDRRNKNGHITTT